MGRAGIPRGQKGGRGLRSLGAACMCIYTRARELAFLRGETRPAGGVMLEVLLALIDWFLRGGGAAFSFCAESGAQFQRCDLV